MSTSDRAAKLYLSVVPQHAPKWQNCPTIAPEKPGSHWKGQVSVGAKRYNGVPISLNLSTFVSEHHGEVCAGAEFPFCGWTL